MPFFGQGYGDNERRFANIIRGSKGAHTHPLVVNRGTLRVLQRDGSCPPTVGALNLDGGWNLAVFTNGHRVQHQPQNVAGTTRRGTTSLKKVNRSLVK